MGSSSCSSYLIYLEDLAEYMTELQVEVIKAFKTNFPLDSRPEKVDASLSDIQFCHSLTTKFANDVVSRLPNYNELDAARISSTLRHSVSIEEWKRFSELYWFGQYLEPSDKVNRDYFLSSMFHLLLRLVEPSKAVCLNSLMVNQKEKEQIYDFVRHIFYDVAECRTALDSLEQVQEGSRGSFSDGLNDWSYSIDKSKVTLVNDGDGAFSDDEIITIELNHSDFQKVTQKWQSAMEIYSSNQDNDR